MTRCLAPLVVALLLSACATVPADPADALPTPPDRVLMRTGGDADIVVVRDKGFMGSGCHFALYVNRQLAARVGPSERVRLKVPAGELLLAMGHDPQGRGLCGAFMRDYRIQREFRIAAGETKHFRMHLSEGGMDIMRSDF